MRPLAVDFTARRPLGSAFGLLLAGLGLAASAALGADYLAAEEELRRVEARVERARRHQPPLRARAPAGGGAAEKDERANVRGIVKALRAPWSALLGELELATDESVAVLDVSTNSQGRWLRLTAEAKTMDDVLAYLGRLRDSPWLDSVALTSHETKQGGAPAIRFAVEVAWSGPS